MGSTTYRGYVGRLARDAWATDRGRLGGANGGPGVRGGLFDPRLVRIPVDRRSEWVLALSSYLSIFRNLNPLIELDGYYTLMHLLDRPNLRRRSLAWLAHDGLAALRHPSRIRGHALEATYALASVAYAAILVVVLYRAVLEDWVADLLGAGAAEVVGWTFAVLTVGFVVAGTVGDVRAARGGGRIQAVDRLTIGLL